MKTNNYYLKKIFENTGGESSNSFKSDNYYLNRIYTNFSGETLSGKHTNTYCLKKIFENVSNSTVSEHHTSNYYLRELLKVFSDESVPLNRTDNYYLSRISLAVSDYTPDTPSGSSLTLSADKTILSQYDEDNCTLSAKLVVDDVPVVNKAVEFYMATPSSEEFLFDTRPTDNNGIAYLSFRGSANGDLIWRAKAEDMTSDDLLIEDCYYFNDGTKKNLVCANGTDVTVENGALKITTTTSGEKKFYFPTINSFSSSQNVMMEIESAREDEIGNIMTVSFNKSVSTYTSGYAGYWTETNDWYIDLYNSAKSVPHTLNKGDKIRLIRKNGESKLYHNEDLIDSRTRSINTYYFGGYTNKDRVQRLKNIKIKKVIS